MAGCHHSADLPGHNFHLTIRVSRKHDEVSQSTYPDKFRERKIMPFKIPKGLASQELHEVEVLTVPYYIWSTSPESLLQILTVTVQPSRA